MHPIVRALCWTSFLTLAACGGGGGDMQDAGICTEPTLGCACNEPDYGECGPLGGFGWVCCGGTWSQFADGPCAPPADGSVPTCTTPSAGCACSEEGTTHCRGTWGWRLRCTGGTWNEEVGRVCC